MCRLCVASLWSCVLTHCCVSAQPQSNSVKNSIVTSPKGTLPSPALVFIFSSCLHPSLLSFPPLSLILLSFLPLLVTSLPHPLSVVAVLSILWTIRKQSYQTTCQSLVWVTDGRPSCVVNHPIMCGSDGLGGLVDMAVLFLFTELCNDSLFNDFMVHT